MWHSVKDKLPKVDRFNKNNPNFLYSKEVSVKIKGKKRWATAELCFTKEYPENGNYWRIFGYSGDWEVIAWYDIKPYRVKLKGDR